MLRRGRIASTAIALGALLEASLASELAAGRRPFQRFDLGDGLSGDRVWDLARDGSGALWVATATGVSRFDGVTFRSFDERHGIPHTVVMRLHVGADGRVWAGSNLGAAFLDPERSAGERPWTAVVPRADRSKRQITSFAETSDGRLFAGGPGGLFALVAEGASAAAERSPRLEPVAGPKGTGRVVGLAPADDGALWVLFVDGLYRYEHERRWSGPGVLPAPLLGPLGPVDLARAADGHLWIAGHRALCALALGRELLDGASPATLEPFEELDAARAPVCVDLDGGLPHATSNRLFQPASDGHLLVGAAAGVVEIVNGRLHLRATAETTSPTLAAVELSSGLMIEDGTLWVGTRTDGLLRFPASGLETFGEAEGVRGAISTLLPTESGALVVTDFFDPDRRLLSFDGERFVDRTPAGATSFETGWAWGETNVIAADGAWWVTDQRGLLRSARIGRDRFAPLERVTLPLAARLAGVPFRLWRERSGALWVATTEAASLARFESAARRWEPIPEIESFGRGEATAWAEAADGTIWLGFYSGGLARRRPGGRFELVETSGREIEGFVYALLADERGRLWVGSGGSGLCRLDRPGEPRPESAPAKHGSALDHLQIYSIASDASGRIVAATAAGLHRLDVDSGELDVLTSADGLPGNWVNAVAHAGDGTLWVATQRALARFSPPGARRPPAPVRIVAFAIDGRPEALPVGGSARIEGRTLAPSERTIEIEVASIHLGAGAPPRYEWRLNDGDWSSPSRDRTLRLAGLAPGPLRIEARAVSADGLRAPETASIELVVRPPLWRTPWFLLALGALLGAALFTLHRLRVARLVALERVRTHIAADLTDVHAPSLHRASILAEVARRQDDAAAGAETLAEIGSTARELAEMTGDIVWAVDPQKDDLASLASRLRRFGAELVEPTGAQFALAAPDDAARIELAAARRRDLYLLIKEALHNVAKYSGAKRVRVSLERRGGHLAVAIADDGRGFADSDSAAAQARGGGRGLGTMRERARRLGGELAIDSTPGAGTTISLSIPL